MNPRLITGTEVMPKVVKALGKRSPTLAAITYFTTDHLGLGSGDVLVVNASQAAVEAGATNPNLLLELIARGVLVGNAETLHAKTIVRGNRVAVGSANSSASTLALTESVLVTVDPTVHKTAARFVMRLVQQSPVTVQELEGLVGCYRPRARGHEPAGDSSRRGLFDPKNVGTVWLYQAEDGVEPPAENAGAAASRAGITGFDNYQWGVMERGESVQVGDVLLGFSRGWLSPPQRFLAVSHDASEDGYVWILTAVDPRHKAVRLSRAPQDLIAEAREVSPDFIVPKGRVGEVLGLWGS